MKSLILSTVMGLATLGLFLGTPGDAQAQRRDRVSARRGNYDGGYYGRGYYGRGWGGYGYDGGYYGSSYAPATTTQSYYYPASTDRYSYYWSNGWHMCYDNVTGQYWYQGSSGTWYLWQ